MSCDNWKLEKDLCRCCHAEGSFINLNLRCEDPQETYTDMLRDSLEIILTPVVGVLAEVTYKICEACILRLRDASNFKKQIIVCEERFKDMYSRNFIKIADSDFNAEVKEEIPDSDPEDLKEEYSNANAGVDDDDEGFNLIQLGAGCLDAADDETHDDRNGLEIVDIKLERKTRGRRKAKNPSVKKTKSEKKVGRPRKTIKEEEETKPIASAKQEKPKRGNQVDDYVTETSDVHTDKNYTCKACKVAYKRLSDLRNHITRKHLKEKFIKCHLCPEKFMYHSHKKQHMYDAHSMKKPEDLICDHCQRSFKRKNTLAEHMMDVHIERKCQHCSLRFPRKKYMFHMNEAHEVPMPTCGVCGLRCLQESALIRHQRNVHLNEKNIPCNFCDKRFYTQANLKDHMITHCQEKVFNCDVCEKSFARKGCYKAHYRIHTGEKPFVCAVCDCAYVQRASLRFHMKSHHPELRAGTSKGAR